MKRSSDWANSPVTFFGVALGAAVVQLTIVAELFADYASSAFA